MSFMMQIEAAQRPPLEQLAVDFFYVEKTAHPSIDFCLRLLGVPEEDAKVARRLNVEVLKVRGWRALGLRASRWSCR